MLISTWAATAVSAQNTESLSFPKDQFTIETKIVKTSNGEKKVTYKSYMHIPYVANPVDKDYQSMNVSVPTQVDGIRIETSNAPILFVIGVGGYMSVNNAKGGGFGPGGPGGAGPGGMRPNGPPPGAGGPPMNGGAPGGRTAGSAGPIGGGPGGNSKTSGKADLALAAGYVVVTPGCRGRDNVTSDGKYYGKAPAAIVDLKAAVRYIRHNKGVLPGNTDRIVSTGVSAGGAMSALLGASGNSPLYDTYLKEIGAADADDNIFATAAFCPITDLEHADGAYEWMYGAFPVGTSGLVDQQISKELRALYGQYQASLNLKGKENFGTITADNYAQYLLKSALIPSANKYLKNLTEEKRRQYLENNKWITWKNGAVNFSFADFVAHVGRMKSMPAFDNFDLTSAETIEFGNKTVNARHFTDYSLQHTAGNKTVKVDEEVTLAVHLLNAMYFIGQKNEGCVKYWWLRQGTSDAHTSQTVMANLAACLENNQKEVDSALYWDAGHGADQDPEEFITWMGKISGFSKKTDAVKK
ncbi:subtype B tannase [Dyadobacter subterraneus]|nr:subtype B tannase [Dyadobacter subterraneus]